jgi:hypothetical protein
VDSHEQNPKNQFLTVMQQYLAYEGWSDDIAIAEDGDASIKTTMRFDGQTHQLYLEGWASIQNFKVYLYSSFSVPPHRHDEIAVLLNFINLRLGLGRFALRYCDDAAPIQFLASVDVEEGEMSVKMICNMIGAGVHSLSRYRDILAAVALTKTTAREVINEILLSEEASTPAPLN